MTNPTRLYETERKRQQRARLAEGQTNRVAVYLTDEELKLLRSSVHALDVSESEAIRAALYVAKTEAIRRYITDTRQTPPTQR